jgi:hypothetical protein
MSGYSEKNDSFPGPGADWSGAADIALFEDIMPKKDTHSGRCKLRKTSLELMTPLIHLQRPEQTLVIRVARI